MNFLQKLDFLMEKYELNKRTLSQKCNIPYTTIVNWYNRGYENLTIPNLRKLSFYFNTTLDFWFLDDVTDPNYGKSSGFRVEYEEMEHIKKYRALDEPGRQRIDYELDRELERITKQRRQADRIKELERELIPKRFIVYYQRLASAGSGEYLFDGVPTDMIAVEDTPVSRKADFVIGVNGNSMEPEYLDGEKVFVEKTLDIEAGEVGVFTRGRECFIKKCGESGLISINPQYPDVEPFDDGVKVVGRILGKAVEIE